MHELRELEDILVKKYGYAYTEGVMIRLLQSALLELKGNSRKAILSDIAYLKKTVA